MKPVILAVVGTAAGVASLLSFKTAQPQATTGALPSAGLSSPAPAGSSSSPATSRPGASSRSSTPAARTQTPAATARSYVGPAITTRYGVVQVKVTASGRRIANVALAQLTAFDQHSQDINSQAAPLLLQETLKAQSAHIDTVSGATYTSDGYEQSLQGALDAAGI